MSFCISIDVIVIFWWKVIEHRKGDITETHSAQQGYYLDLIGVVTRKTLLISCNKVVGERK